MALQSASHLPAGGPAPRGITNWTAIVMFPKQIPCPRPRSHPALDLSLLERLPSFTAILSCPCCTQRFSTEQYHLLSLSEIPHHFQDHTPHSVLQQNSGLFGFFFFSFEFVFLTVSLPWELEWEDRSLTHSTSLN